MSDKLTDAINSAILLTRQQHSGVLATISTSVAGYPFGSIIPYLVNHQGDVIIYASDIAQHARNIKADAKVSVFIHDPLQEDSQANARVTIVGDATVDAVNELDKQRYFRLFPQAKSYEQMHDFRFYLIKTKRVRFIGGFGEIYWLPEEAWRDAFVDLGDIEMGAISHMHEDHADALQIIAAYHRQQDTAETVEMLSILHNGCHLKTHEGIIFVPFITPLTNASDMRKAVVEITKQARAGTPK